MSSSETSTATALPNSGQTVVAPPQELVHVDSLPPNRLTISFQGAVYVFDSVSSQRVQDILLVLNGQELPSHIDKVVTSQVNSVVGTSNLSCNNDLRLASLAQEKKRKLCFDKNVGHSVRKEVASRKKRHKGKFVPPNTNSEEALSTSSSSDLAQSSREDTYSFCQNCGVSKDSTPMMRCGFSDLRSLCNACGLVWANKNTLRDVPRSPPSVIQTSSIDPSDQIDTLVFNMFSATSHDGSLMVDDIDADMDFLLG